MDEESEGCESRKQKETEDSVGGKKERGEITEEEKAQIVWLDC